MSPRASGSPKGRSPGSLWSLPDGPLVLASASPRRRDLLAMQGIRFEVMTTDVDESDLLGTPRAVVRRLARAKARVIAGRRPGSWVIGADTVVTLGGQNLGKPAGPADARRMLRLLSGREHVVHTGVALIGPGLERAGSRATRVRFRRLEEGEIRAYVASGEPMDKAGAYALQGLGAVLVDSLAGDWTNVIGLPLGLLRDLLARAACRG